MNARRIGSLLVVTLTVGATLLTASSAAAYNEENVKQIRMERLDAVSCTAPIRILAALTDSSGNAVPGAQVQFTYKKSAAGDSLAPTTVFSDAAGHAQTTIQLSCTIGSRIIRASVPGDGSAQLVVTCSPRNGCTGHPQGGVLGIVGLPESDTGVDGASPATVVREVDNLSFGGAIPLLAASMLIAVLGLVRWSRRREPSRP
jgi:hypothetical protein